MSCLGVRDRANDGVFDRTVSQFDNDISNASALFELADGGVMRINEMRVGYPADIRESRFRFFGTEGSFEQLAEVSVWQDKERVTDVSNLLHSAASMSTDDPALEHVAPELREAFISGHAPIHDTSRLPASFSGAPNGHEGSHHPGGRLRPGGSRRDAPTSERLEGCPFHAARHRRPRVRSSRR